MPDRRGTRQALDRRLTGKMIADEAEPLFGEEPAPVEGDDARRLLSAMLQRMQSQRGDRRGVGVAEDAEYPAFLAQAVGFGIERQSGIRA